MAKRRTRRAKASQKGKARRRVVTGPSSRKKSAAAAKAKKKGKKKAPLRRARETGTLQGVMRVEDVLIIPVRNMILFPGVVLPLMIGRERSIRAIKRAVDKKLPVGLLLQKDEASDTPRPEDLYRVGTLADVMRYWIGPDGRHHAICQGNSRLRVREFVQTEPVLKARVEVLAIQEGESRAIEARFVALRQRAHEVLQLAPGAPEDLAQAVQGIQSPSLLADMVATFIDVPAVEKQEVLETFDLKKRLDRVNAMLGEVAEVLELSAKIRRDTKGSIDKAQREYYLREQLRAIQRELGEGDEKTAELAELSTKIDALGLEPEAARDIRRELVRLERLPEQAAEHSMLRTYLEVVSELPWRTSTEDRLDLARAERILDEDHYGLDKVKRRILEFLAVRKLNPSGHGPTLCLVGPPGVGKTSLGQSVARAMDRRFVRTSLGGVHDEAEIRGHRRTYIGAMPGRIIDGLRRAGSNNPVFMLDEMDKLGAGLHGDPSSAMLEVLDPAQHHAFVDNYLGVAFDLSRVLFIGTANVLEGIPGALRDRLEVISIPGYTEEEKLEIAKRYLVKRAVSEAGLRASQCRIGVPALREIIRHYTREAGVRGLEREISALTRRVATLVARGEWEARTLGIDDVQEVLGPPRFEGEVLQRTAVPGVATGLAWTPFGGEILFVEATRVPGKGRLILTGQLGDVMKESAEAALSLVRSRSTRYGIDPALFDEHLMHVHVPAGAVPKDGPSAGVAMFTALVSVLTGRCVRSDVGVTGEISLRGLVLPVGGIKEKVLAAQAAGLRRVLLPERNRKDLQDIPASAREKLEIEWLETVDDAIRLGLEAEAGPGA